VLGNQVFDRLIETDEILGFTKKKYLLLQALRKNQPLEEAAAKLDFSLEEAREFADSPKAKKYLQDRQLAEIIAAEAKDPTRAWVRLEMMNQGQAVRKSQVEALKMTMDRVDPIKKQSDGNERPTYTFNFTMADVKGALDRQKAIDAEIAA